MAERLSYPVEIMAKLLLLTPRRVQQLANEGVIHKSERGRYDLIKSVQGYIQYLNDLLPNKSSSDAGQQYARADAEVERGKLLAEKAIMARYDRLAMEGKLLDAEDVRRDAYRAAINVRRAILSAPDRVAPVLLEAKNAREVRSILRRELTDALIDVSKVIESGDPTGSFDPLADYQNKNKARHQRENQ